MASKVRKKTSKASLRSSGRDKNRFSLYTKLLVTGETFRARGVFGEMKIGALKGCLEFTIGIPQNLQRISYLDEGDLLDKSDVKSNDIVPGGTLHVRLWPMWNDLIEAVASNDIDKVFSLGVTQATAYKTPNSEYMSQRSKKAWLADRAFVALCVASHRGHADLVKKLIKSGANVNTTTPLGRTPLHLASSQGHGQIVDALLQNGADIDAVDCNGMTSLMIAEQFEHKGCGRHLFLFRWQQRAKKMQPALQRPLMAHQMFDSAYPIWKNGKQCQLYVTKLEPPGEFEGTRIDSKPYKPFPDKSFRGRYGSPVNLQVVKTSSNGEKLMPVPLKQEDEMNTNLRTADHVPPNFDDWLKQLKNKEHQIRLRKIRSEERRKQEEEDRQKPVERKREESEKNQSYESWLAQQEMDRGKDARLTPDQRQQDQHSLGSYQRPSSNKKGALREYLESLADRRGASSYSDWLIKKEIEMLDSVEARPVIKTK